MTLKAIKISEENYKKLIILSADLQKSTGEIVSIDKAISSLLNKQEKPATTKSSDSDNHRHYVG